MLFLLRAPRNSTLSLRVSQRDNSAWMCYGCHRLKKMPWKISEINQLIDFFQKSTYTRSEHRLIKCIATLSASLNLSASLL